MSGKAVAFHKTVRGHLHILKDIPCEDYSASFSDGGGRYDIVVVADGHGDRACMRSAYGAQAVVEVALDCLKTLAEDCLTNPDVLADWTAPRSARQMVKQLTDTIISRWYQRIDQNQKEEPLTEAELDGVERYADDYRAGKRLEHIYGTTLIAALRLPEYLLLIQQGDGRCDVFYGDGSVDQPIPWDERCFENVTTSMCDEDVTSSIRHCIIPLKERPVIACYIGSDGVEDSYRDMEGTHTFYRNLSSELVQRGPEAFEAYLEDMLPGFSTSGSGDDVSVAGIVDIEAMKGFLPLFQCLAQRYELSETKAYYEEKINSMTRKHSILKKRAEEARSEWERREVNLLLSSAGKEQALLDRRESAEREFREYDEKYRDLHDKLKALNAKMDALSQGGTGETEEPIPEPEEAPEPDAAKEPETVPSEAPEKAAAGAAPGQQA